MANHLTPWKDPGAMLSATRAATQRADLPTDIFKPTRSCWGTPDPNAGLDWAVLKEARGPSIQPLATE